MSVNTLITAFVLLFALKIIKSSLFILLIASAAAAAAPRTRTLLSGDERRAHGRVRRRADAPRAHPRARELRERRRGADPADREGDANDLGALRIPLPGPRGDPAHYAQVRVPGRSNSRTLTL